MKTIVLLAFASLWMVSMTTAQTNYHSFDITNTAAAEEEAALSVVPEELAPSHGTTNAWFPDFRRYVRENVRYPMSAQESGIQGVVAAEAIVDEDGRLTDIRIVEGLSYSCDREVKRLLTNMPAWKPARRNGEPFEQKVFVRVRFKLVRH